jgi:hypothetical protein
VRAFVAIACAVLSLSESACVIGPTGGSTGDDGTVSDTSTRTLGDQCQDVVNAFCQRLPGCAINLSYSDCMSNFLPECCEGSACSQLSTVSESTVDACEQTLETEDCSIVNDPADNDPVACLQ